MTFGQAGLQDCCPQRRGSLSQPSPKNNSGRRNQGNSAYIYTKRITNLIISIKEPIKYSMNINSQSLTHSRFQIGVHGH